MTAAGIPDPVSATSRRTPSGRAAAAIDSVPPSGMASSALVTRLSSAISSCVASALTAGRSSAIEACSRIFERDSRGWASSRTRSMMSARSTTSRPDGCRAWSSIVRSTRVTCWICASTVSSRARVRSSVLGSSRII